MGIKIPSNFLMVGWGSGRQAEQTCCLHLLVMCLPPRAEVIQKSPSNLLVPPPGQVMGSILVPWRTGGALGDLGMGGVFPPAASQLNSLRLGAARGGGPNPFSRLQLPFQAIELEALLSASRPKRDQEGWKQTSAGTAEPLASQDGRSPLASLPASALALQSVVPEPPRGSSETENPTSSLSHLLKPSQDLPLHSQHPQSFQSPRRPRDLVPASCHHVTPSCSHHGSLCSSSGPPFCPASAPGSGLLHMLVPHPGCCCARHLHGCLLIISGHVFSPHGDLTLPLSRMCPPLHTSHHLLNITIASHAKDPPTSAGDIRDVGSIPGSQRSPGEGNGNPLQYSCLENPMD